MVGLSSVFHIKKRRPLLEGVFDDFFAKNGYPSSRILKWAGGLWHNTPPEKKNSSPQCFGYFVLALFFGDRYLTKHFEIFCNNMNFGLIYRALIPQKSFKVRGNSCAGGKRNNWLTHLANPKPLGKARSFGLIFRD